MFGFESKLELRGGLVVKIKRRAPARTQAQRRDRRVVLKSRFQVKGANGNEVSTGCKRLMQRGMIALLVDGEIVGIEMPPNVVLEIVDTAPGIKGSSATARTKSAKLSTGLEVQVPEYLETGELIKVNTTNAKFVSRA